MVEHCAHCGHSIEFEPLVGEDNLPYHPECYEEAEKELTETNSLSSTDNESTPFMCHFKPMKYEWGDNGNGGTEEYFVCSVCGHVKDPTGKAVEQ